MYIQNYPLYYANGKNGLKLQSCIRDKFICVVDHSCFSVLIDPSEFSNKRVSGFEVFGVTVGDLSQNVNSFFQFNNSDGIRSQVFETTGCDSNYCKGNKFSFSREALCCKFSVATFGAYYSLREYYGITFGAFSSFQPVSFGRFTPMFCYFHYFASNI